MSRAAATELEPLVNNFEHLSDKRRADEALQTLRKIASLVKPLMRQRNWRVGTLAEFYPPENNLLGLNINRGQKICLRLRHAGDETQFLPIESVVDTMLHELAHNVHGPHDQHFHALWDKLRDEHQALVMKGYTGEGFLGHGARLGGRRIPLDEARRQARAAAERRRTLNIGSGQRLGGQGIIRGQDPRAIIAAAAERRQRIERGCASNTDKGRQIADEQSSSSNRKNITRTTAEQQDQDEATLMQAYIDLIQEDERNRLGELYIPPSQENPAGSKALPQESTLLKQQREIEDTIRQQTFTSTTSTSTPVPTPPKHPTPPPPPPQEPTTWTCEICTLVNPLLYLACEACTVERPAHISAMLPSTSPPSPPFRAFSNTHTSSTASNHHPPTTRRETPNALKPRLNAYANAKRFADEDQAIKNSTPLGWMCGGCGTFMEREWWTCAGCGRMKDAS